MRGKFRNIWLVAMASIVASFIPMHSASAQDTAGKFYVQPGLFLGGGASKVDVGTTTGGDNVSISGGGGVGGGLTLGYGVSSQVDLDITLGYQESQLSPKVENASGTFSRAFYLATVKYRIPVNDRMQVKIGAGAGIYKPNNLDVNTSSVSNGSHNIVKYDDAAGFHVQTELEIFFANDFSADFGLKYYNVTYKESSGIHNGTPVTFTDSNLRNFDGSGVDVILAVAKYF